MLDEALAQVKTLLLSSEDDAQVTIRCLEQRIRRFRKIDDVVQEMVRTLKLPQATHSCSSSDSVYPGPRGLGEVALALLHLCYPLSADSREA
jgi:hypothetical protein